MNASRAEIDIDFATKIATVETKTDTLESSVHDLTKVVTSHEKALGTLESLPKDVAQIRNALYLLVVVLAFKDNMSLETVEKIVKVFINVVGVIG